MAEGVVFLLAPFTLALFGLPAAWAKPVERFSTAGRFSAAFVTGVVVFTVWLTLLSAAGIRWSTRSVVVPLGVGSIAFAAALARRARGSDGSVDETGAAAWLVGSAALVIGSAHLVLTALTSRATSIDYLYFWGVKAQRFAELGAIDARLLSDPFSVHMHSNYPPLVPLVYGWGIELAGRLPWQLGLATCAVWLVAGVPLLRDLLAPRVSIDKATLVSSFWFLAFSLAVPASLSAGNAEPPLVLLSSVAVAALLGGAGVEGVRWLAIVALAGVVLTKNEGVVVFALIAMGAIAHDYFGGMRGRRLGRRAAALIVIPLMALGSWLLFEALHGVPMQDATRENAGVLSLGRAGEVGVEFLRNLDAGSFWIAWLMAAFLVAFSWRRWREFLPALVPALGILLFLFVYYLHYQGDDLEVWIRWTMPRVSLCALGAAIIGAACAGAPNQKIET